MSPQEAAGSRFDALYFLRASDLAWPTRPGMNPLLGWRLQRDLQMPGSDAAQDADHARRITHRLAASAPVAVFSYAKETADAHQRPSSSLSGLPLHPLPAPHPLDPSDSISLETSRRLRLHPAHQSQSPGRLRNPPAAGRVRLPRLR